MYEEGTTGAVIATVLLLATATAVYADAPSPPGLDLSGLGNTFRDAVVQGVTEVVPHLGHDQRPLSVPAQILNGFSRALGWLGQHAFRGLLENAGGGDNMLVNLSPGMTVQRPAP